MWTDILIYSLKVSIILAILYPIYWLLFRKNNRFALKRVSLIAIIILSLSAPPIKFEPVLNSPISTYSFESLELVLQERLKLQDLPTIQSKSEVAIEEFSETQSTMTSLEISTIIYMLGVLISSLYFIFQLGALFFLVKGSNRSFETDNVKCHRLVRHPFSFGKWIFVPLETKYDKATWSTIIKHERAHISQKHSLDLLFSSFMKIILWYNPLVYLINRSIKYNHECLADKAVLKKLEISTYSRQLLNAAFETSQFSMGHSFALNSSIKKRIMVMKTKKTTLIKTTFSTMALLATFFLVITQTSAIAQDDSLAKSKMEANSKDLKHSMNMLHTLKERPTNILFIEKRFIPVQGLPKHLRALEKLQNEYPEKRLALSYFDMNIAEYLVNPPQSTNALKTRGEILFTDVLGEEGQNALYEESAKWANEKILPSYPDYEMIDREHFEKYKYVSIRVIPSYEEGQQRYKDTYKYGTKAFKMNQVDKLPEPAGGLENFLRNVALHAEMDPSLSIKDLPKNIEFSFEIGLQGQMTSIKLTSSVRGSDETQDKIYKLLRQIHDNLKPNLFYKWEPGKKDGSPVVTEMKVEIPKKYLIH